MLTDTETTLLNDILKLHDDIESLHATILENFKLTVDSDPEAYISYDDLIKIENDFKEKSAAYNAQVKTVEDMILDLQEKYSKYGDIRTQNFSAGKTAFSNFCGDDEPEGYLDELVDQAISNIAPSVSGEAADFIIDQSASFICGKIGEPASGIYTFGAELIKLKDEYEQSVEAAGAVQMLNYGNGVEAMYVSGSVVHISGSSVNSAYVYSPQYDEINLRITLEAYNRDKDTSYTPEDMKTAYCEQSELFDDYRTWFKKGGRKKASTLKNEVEKAFGYYTEDVDNMDLKELEEYFEEDN